MDLSELQLNRNLYKTQPQTLETLSADDVASNLANPPSTAISSGNSVTDINTNSETINGSQLTPGTVPQTELDIANWGWTQSCPFSVANSGGNMNVILWLAGTFTSADGTSVYSIQANSTFILTTRTYIYLDINISTNSYHTTTNQSTVVGLGKVLIAVCDPGPVRATFALVQATQVVADNVVANTITAEKMNVGQLSAISANMGSITSGTITGALIRTAPSGQRVELNSALNAMIIYNSTGTSLGFFGNAGANGNFMSVSQVNTGQDFPPIFMTSDQSSNVINAINTNTSVSNRPAFRFQSNSSSSEAMFVQQTGSYVSLGVEGNSNGFATLVLIQNGSGPIINTNVAGCFLTKSGVWTDASSKTLKENFEEIPVLEILKNMDILKYNYKVDSKKSDKDLRDHLILMKKKNKLSRTDEGQKGGIGNDDEIGKVELDQADLDEIEKEAQEEISKERSRVPRKHFTPMAEDFHAMFGLGDGKGISPNDSAGIALQAIKELAKKVEELEARITK